MCRKVAENLNAHFKRYSARMRNEASRARHGLAQTQTRISGGPEGAMKEDPQRPPLRGRRGTRGNPYRRAGSALSVIRLNCSIYLYFDRYVGAPCLVPRFRPRIATMWGSCIAHHACNACDMRIMRIMRIVRIIRILHGLQYIPYSGTAHPGFPVFWTSLAFV